MHTGYEQQFQIIESILLPLFQIIEWILLSLFQNNWCFLLLAILLNRSSYLKILYKYYLFCRDLFYH
jgi:hypothetical protein